MQHEQTVPAPGAWAFWRYDQFPYLLGGKIGEHPATGEWHRGANVYVPSYQSYFKPLFCVPAEHGGQVRAEIERLSRAARTEQEAMQRRLGELRRESALHCLDPRGA